MKEMTMKENSTKTASQILCHIRYNIIVQDILDIFCMPSFKKNNAKKGFHLQRLIYKQMLTQLGILLAILQIFLW